MDGAAFTPVANRGLIMLTVMSATIMQAVDNTIANVALPHLQGSLSASQDQIAWVLTSYIVAAAIATPLTGWLAGRFGRKLVFGISVAGFTIASALCGSALSLEQIVLYRFLQGVFGAALIPLSQSVLLDITPPAQYGRAMAIWGMGVMVGPIVGPVLGGWLTETFNWRWVFLINLPIGVLSLAGLVLFVKETRKQPMTFDFFGFTSLSIAVGALQLVLDRGQDKGWFGSSEIVIEASVALVAFYLFAVHTATTERQSFFNRALLRDRNFVAGNILVFLMAMVLLSTLALLPPLMQQLLGFPVVTAGIATAPRGVGTMIGMMLMGRLMEKFDTRVIMLAGIFVSEAALWQMSHFSLDVGMSQLVISGILQGLGMGFVWVPLSTIGFATLAGNLRNEGTAVFSLVRNLGSSVGISIWEALLAQNSQRVHARLVELVRPDNPLARPPFLPAPLLSATPEQLAAVGGQVSRQAAMVAYNDDFWGMMLTTLVMFPLMLLLRKPRRQGGADRAVAAD